MADLFFHEMHNWEAGLKSIYSRPFICLPKTNMEDESNPLTKQLKAELHKEYTLHLSKLGINKKIDFPLALHLTRVNIAHLVTLKLVTLLDGQAKDGTPMRYAKITREGIDLIMSKEQRKIGKWALYISILATIATVSSAAVTILNLTINQKDEPKMTITTLQELKEKVLKDPNGKAAYDNDTLDIKDVEVIFHPEKAETDSDER